MMMTQLATNLLCFDQNKVMNKTNNIAKFRPKVSQSANHLLSLDQNFLNSNNDNCRIALVKEIIKSLNNYRFHLIYQIFKIIKTLKMKKLLNLCIDLYQQVKILQEIYVLMILFQILRKDKLKNKLKSKHYLKNENKNQIQMLTISL